jgi:hypothetical protein
VAVHRWIEQRAGTHSSLFGALEVVAAVPATAPTDQVDPGSASDFGAAPPHGGDGAAADRSPDRALTGFRSAFLASPYGDLEPGRIEAPFVLALGGRVIRGRIDALYQRDGLIDVVDFKTGRPPEDGDRGATVQLDTYAVAAVDVWSVDPSALRTTYCYLNADGSFHLAEFHWSAERVGYARSDLSATARRLGEGTWPATPGGWCRRCEWRQVCRAGKEFLATEDGVPPVEPSEATEERLAVPDVPPPAVAQGLPAHARSLADRSERPPSDVRAG